MRIRDDSSIGGASRYDANSAAETLAELEAQFGAGEIEKHTYFLKKRSLVSLFLKATTNPTRARNEPEEEL